jgi:hypothetical protein
MKVHSDKETKVAKTAAKRPAKKKKAASPKTARRKKKVATSRKKKVAVKKRVPAGRKKKVTKKKATKKKAAKRGASKTRAVAETQLEKRVKQLTEQLDEMREIVQKEVAKDLTNTRKYAEAEMALQKRRFDRMLKKIKQENKELRSWMDKFVEEHEVLKGVTKGVADTAKSLEERVRKIVSG